MDRFVGTVVVGMACAVTGCGTNPAPETFPVRGVVRMTEGTVSVGNGGMAAPIVSTTDAAGRCEDHPPEVLDPGQEGLSMVWDEPPTRRLNVVLDPTGSVLRYSDVRGDLDPNDGGEGPRTSIHLDFPARRALLVNRTASGAQEAMRLDFELALDDPDLGEPRRIISDLLARCGERGATAPVAPVRLLPLVRG